MTLPNFLIIGAAKCGSTSIYHYVGQHPQVYMSPIKEPMFFVLDGQEREFRPGREKEQKERAVYEPEAYEQLFEDVADEIAIGEASTQYLHSSRAPDRIKHYVPHAKLIAVLRDPVERAYSSYLMSVRLGHETKGFAQAIQAELHQARSGLKWWMKRHYLEVGFYYRHLQGYYARFDGRQIRIYLYDDLKADPQHLLQEIFRFLGVDESFVPDFSVKHLVSGIPKNKAGGFVIGLLERLPLKDALRRVIPDRVRHRLMYAVESRLVTEPPSLDPEIRADLIEIFRDDLRRLQDLIQRDLSHWMT